ncbi:MAG: hypothetical protein ACR2PL_05160, partial [Dehalococcoidia bacterium]
LEHVPGIGQELQRRGLSIHYSTSGESVGIDATAQAIPAELHLFVGKVDTLSSAQVARENDLPAQVSNNLGPWTDAR